MAGMDTRGRRDHAPDTIDFSFLAGMAILAAAVVAISVKMDLSAVSDVAMLVAL